MKTIKHIVLVVLLITALTASSNKNNLKYFINLPYKLHHHVIFGLDGQRQEQFQSK